ncbi:MAG TPA: lipid-A-disaccharide synthase [Cytophagales bacterium]|nr:lipid-A-disaccharide synthase [Cytophagales bacterium]HRG10790.1 lipid-A-disaccharide synthase [Cyclobacteriaceae bacterium]
MKYYIIAGERSGDLHGSNLVKSLSRLQPHASFRGFGGDEMQRAGVELVMHYNQLAFMGFEAVLNFFKIARYMADCKKDILQYKPSALILIDYGGFNRRIASFGKANGIPVHYYIPPKVWAWRQNRAWQLKKSVNHMYVILPFEKDFFKKYNFDVDYVGNPVLDAIRSFKPAELFLEQNNLKTTQPLIALLPGSRTRELQKIVPVMAEVAKAQPAFHFAVAAIRNLHTELYKPLAGLKNVSFIYDATYDLLTHASAAIVTSGTATLETALFKVPQVVVYKAGYLEYLIAAQVVKVKFISLVNLIAGHEVVKELIQDKASVQHIGEELIKLVAQGSYRENMQKTYDQLYTTLDIGSASDNTAQLIVKYQNAD